MIEYNPIYKRNGSLNGAITTAPSNSLIFDLAGKAIWAKGVKLKGTDHTYTFSHDNYITLTNTPGSDESEDIKIGVNITTLKAAIDTTYSVVTASSDGLAPMFSSGNLADTDNTDHYYLGIKGSTLKWYKNAYRQLKVGDNVVLGVTDRDPLQIVSADSNLSVSWNSTNKLLVIKNEKPAIGDLTDINVSQFKVTDNINYRLLFKGTANDNNYTGVSRFSEYLLFNPSTKLLTINGNRVITAVDVYVGATSEANATVGLVPAATSAQRTYFLRGDGTWLTIVQENTWRPIQVSGSEKLGGATDTGALNFVAGTGIEVSWDTTNKRIVITNTSPDQDHNTDRTSIKLGTVSGTKKTDSTLIINDSATGLTIAGGTNKFSIGDGTNYIEVPITIAHGLSTKNMKINGTDYAIYTSASSLPTFFAPGSLGNNGQLLGTDGSTLTWITPNWAASNHNHDASYVTAVGAGSGDHASELYYTKNGSNTYFTVPYATISGYTNRFSSHGTSNWDANNLTYPIAENYGQSGGSSNYPGGYGSVFQILASGGSSLGGQFFWSINHNSTASTGNLYFRAGNNLGWQNDWKRVAWASEIPTKASWNYDDVYSKLNHTHSLSIATTSDTSSISLVASTKYKLTAGDSTYVFTSTPDLNVKQTPQTDNANRPLMMINGETSTGELINTSIFSTGIYANTSTKTITASGFIKTGSSNLSVLLAGGGAKSLGTFLTYINTNYNTTDYDPNNANNFEVWSIKGLSNLPNFPYGALMSFPYNLGNLAWNKQLYITNGDSSNPGIYIRWSYGNTWLNWIRIALVTDNVASATKLETARTLTIGDTGKTFDGTVNVSWSLAEIGAQPAGSYAAAAHDHYRLGTNILAEANINDALWSGIYNVTPSSSSSLPGTPTNSGNVMFRAAWANGSNTAGFNLLINDSVNSNLYFRPTVGGGGMGNWRTLLDSINYTNFTVTKDGTGATGTWAINISGNAATSTTSKYPYGFGGYQLNNNWPGVSGNSIIVGWQDPQKGGEAVWLTNGSGQLSLAVDGFFYQGIDSRGNHRVVDTYDLASYYTKTDSDARYVSNVSISGNYLRVTKNGSNTDLTIPYATTANTANIAKKILMTDSSNMNIWEGTANYIGFYCYRGTATGCPTGYPYGYLLNYAYYNGNNSWSCQLYLTVADFGSEIFTRGYNLSQLSWTTWKKFWNEANDGAGSGLDADLLDGNHASAFAAAAHDHNRLSRVSITSTNFAKANWSGFYNVSADGTTALPGANSGGNVAIHAAWDDGSNIAGLDLLINDNTESNLYYRARTGGGPGSWKTLLDSSNYTSYVYSKSLSDSNYVLNVSISGNYLRVQKNNSNTDLTIPFATRSETYTLKSSNTFNFWEGTGGRFSAYLMGGVNDGCPSGYPYGYLYNYAWASGQNTWSGLVYFTVSDFGSEIFTRGYRNDTKTWTAWRKFWHELNDGSGSGLDADLIDGVDSDRIVYGSNATKTTTSSYSYNSAFPSGFYTNNGQFALHCAYHGVGNVAGWTLYTADGTDVPLNFIVQNGGGGGHSYELISSKGGQTINGTLYLKYSTYPNLLLNNTGTECTMYFFNNTNHRWIVGSNPWGVGTDAFAIGDYAARFILYADGTAKFTGNLYAPNFYSTSDIAKKKNISSFSEHIRKFQLKDTEKWHYGVIAQEVPEMFRDGEEGNMTVNYNSVLSFYIGLLENKVKMLEERIKRLESK